MKQPVAIPLDQDVLVNNDWKNHSIEQLEDMVKYMQKKWLYAYALDIQFVIADKIMEDIKSGKIQTLPESDTLEMLAAAKEVVRKKYS